MKIQMSMCAAALACSVSLTGPAAAEDLSSNAVAALGDRNNLKVHRVIEDQNTVVTHSSYTKDGKAVVSFDIFEFTDGKIVSQKTGTQHDEGVGKSGRTMTDGPTEITDVAKTAMNKVIVGGCYGGLLLRGDSGVIPACYDGDNYLQHNAAVADGLSGLFKFLEEMANQGVAMKFSKINKVIGEGNFVLVQASATVGGKPTEFYDLFRVENGFLAEHWDIIAPVKAE